VARLFSNDIFWNQNRQNEKPLAASLLRNDILEPIQVEEKVPGSRFFNNDILEPVKVEGKVPGGQALQR
jgi:hypothetical protein